MKNTKKKGENRLANNKTLSIVGAIVAVCLIAILTIHFVVPSFSWYWFAFCAILVVVPCGICCIYVFRNQKISFTPKQKTIEIRRSVKMVLLWLLADLLFMAIFNGFTTWIYILGVTFVLATLLNLANAFLREGKRNAVANFFSALDLLLCLFATIYLIYIIPLELQRLQTIVTTIIAAVYGGLLTLFGVAWTIKRSDLIKRQDEIKRAKPIFTFDKVDSHTNERQHKHCIVKSDKAEYRNKLLFLVENSEHATFYLSRLHHDGKWFEIEGNKIVLPNGICHVISEFNDFGSEFLEVQDTLGLIYYYELTVGQDLVEFARNHYLPIVDINEISKNKMENKIAEFLEVKSQQVNN